MSPASRLGSFGPLEHEMPSVLRNSVPVRGVTNRADRRPLLRSR